MIDALYQKARTGAITLAAGSQAATNFNRDWHQRYQIVEVSSWTSDQAMVLATQYLVRGYDAVHLAAALDVNRYYQAKSQPPITFVSADIEQLRVAAIIGLPTDNPDQHP